MIDRRKNSAEHRPQAQVLIGIVVAAAIAVLRAITAQPLSEHKP